MKMYIHYFFLFKVNSFEQEFKPRIMKQMMDHFPYDLLQKNAKSKSDKKSNLVECDSNDGNVINQINLGLILLYLDFTSGDVDEQFGLKIINYLKGEFFATTHTN